MRARVFGPPDARGKNVLNAVLALRRVPMCTVPAMVLREAIPPTMRRVCVENEVWRERLERWTYIPAV
jgi:hypothetical protein